MNLGEIRTLTRTLLSEPTGSYWSDAELNNYINLGSLDFCTRTNCIESIGTQSTVQYQADYDPPDDYLTIKQIEYIRGNTVYPVFIADLKEFFTGIVRVSNTAPNDMSFWDGQIRLGNRLSNGASSTTLGGNISASATTITVADSSGLPRVGRVIIGSEVIGYYDNSSNTLSACQRGLEGTTAATHTLGDTVTHRDLWVYYNKKDATLSSDTDTPNIPNQFHSALAYYAAALGRRKSKDHDLADKYDAQYEKSVAHGLEWVKFKLKKAYRTK